MNPKFKKTPSGFEIVDPIERKRYPIKTNTEVMPESVSSSPIHYPMDSTMAITTTGFTLPDNNIIYVRESDGTLYSEVHPGNDVSLSRGEYILDISGPLKIYAYVNSTVEIYVGAEKSILKFQNKTDVIISARSFHRRPAETIKTTTDPIDVMKAVSTFGSALKTTGTERSYPTLRGHPPTLELTDELHIPDTVRRPQTGITIEVPPSLQYIFATAPLAYYLAAEIVPSSTPQLVTETGKCYSLNKKDEFETTVGRTLRQIFLLDCIVRTAGETPGPIHGQSKIESELKYDIEDIYNQPLQKQLEIYLEVPFQVIQPYLPKWEFETQLAPTPSSIESLPFVVNSLTTIRTNDTIYSVLDSANQSIETHNHHQNSEYAGGDSQMYDKIKSADRGLVHQLWKDPTGTQIRSTGSLSAFRNTITQSPRDESPEIDIICNDPEMSEELVQTYSTYDDRDDLSFNITIHHNLTVSELREILAQKSDFVHYIGHIDTEGFQCADGTLDATQVENVGSKAFFLNACQSYKQGYSLIKAGSLGGIVTLAEIENSSAVISGSIIAQLLSFGLPLYGAMNVLQSINNHCDEYHIIGDSTLTISQTEEAVPFTAAISKQEKTNVEIDTYITPKSRLGGLCVPYISSSDAYYITSDRIGFQKVKKGDLIEFLNTGEFPVLFDGELRWSNEIRASDL